MFLILTQLFVLILTCCFSSLADPSTEPPSNENKLARIQGLGEFVSDISRVRRTFIRKLFPKKDPEKTAVEDVPELMREVAKGQEGRLRSAIRGGARIVLALMLAHYRTTKPACLASGMPSTTRAEESTCLFTEVFGYATHISDMVNVETHFEAVPCLEIPDRFSDEESSEEDNQ